MMMILKCYDLYYFIVLFALCIIYAFIILFNKDHSVYLKGPIGQI